MDAKTRKVKMLPFMVFGIHGAIIAVLVVLCRLLGIANLHSVIPWGPRADWIVIGIVLAVLAAPFFVGAVRTLGRETAAGFGDHLVNHAVYRYTRNPMYFGLHFTILGIGFILNSTGVVLTAILAALFGIVTAKREESVLLAKYGEPYREYRKQTSFYVPNYFRLMRDMLSSPKVKTQTR